MRQIPLRLKVKFYKMAIRPAMLYEAECWAAKKQRILRKSVAKMRMVRLERLASEVNAFARALG